MNDPKTSVLIVREKILYSGETYIVGKNFTLPLVHLNGEFFAGNLGAYEIGKVERFFGGAKRVFIVIAICPDSYERGNNGKKNSKQSPQKLPNDPQTPIKRGGGQNHIFLYKHFK